MLRICSLFFAVLFHLIRRAAFCKKNHRDRGQVCHTAYNHIPDAFTDQFGEISGSQGITVWIGGHCISLQQWDRAGRWRRLRDDCRRSDRTAYRDPGTLYNVHRDHCDLPASCNEYPGFQIPGGIEDPAGKDGSAQRSQAERTGDEKADQHAADGNGTSRCRNAWRSEHGKGTIERRTEKDLGLHE